MSRKCGRKYRPTFGRFRSRGLRDLSMEDQIRQQWEENSEVFTELIAGVGTPHHKVILNPCVEELLGEVKGKHLLDAGCGEGYLARHYAKKGAKVTAIDLSPRLIAASKKISANEGLDIEFQVGNVCNIKSIEDETFDVVLSNLVLLNTPCLDDALKEYSRVLKKGGVLVFSIVHPAFNFYGPGSWEMGEKDPKTKRRDGLFFKVDNYFDEKEYTHYWKTRSGEKFPAPISFFHRTLATYLNAIISSGLILIDFKEPRPSTDDQFFDRERRVPFFAVFKAKKTYTGANIE